MKKRKYTSKRKDGAIRRGEQIERHEKYVITANVKRKQNGRYVLACENPRTLVEVFENDKNDRVARVKRRMK